jgi:hypothetical protein
VSAKCVERIGLALVRLIPGAKTQTPTVLRQSVQELGRPMLGEHSGKGPGAAFARVELFGTLQQVEHQFLVEILTVGAG